MSKIRYYDNADRPPKKELCEHYLDGDMSMDWLSDHYGVTLNIIRRWLDDYGIRKSRQYTRLDDRAVYTLKQNGFSFDEIATVFNTFKPTVQNRHKKYLEWLEDDQ